MSLPPYVDRALVQQRLLSIFSEGTPNRIYCVRELAASTVFTALYIGAIEGSNIYLGPIHVYRMTSEQAIKSNDADRSTFEAAIRRKDKIAGTRWYADNTRESIRDETLRDGLVAVGAISQRKDLPTTSGRPRYALKAEFAVLFDPNLKDVELRERISAFQNLHLSKSALARVTIMRAGAVADDTGVIVSFPNGETRRLAPGPSSQIAKAVVEVFSKRFLDKPAVLWLSESGNKVVLRDDRIASAIGLNIEADKNLPDLIFADLGPTDPLLVFVEIVATDGPITYRRQEAIYALTDAAGFHRTNVTFLTAYQDRESVAFKKTVAQIAWKSFAWFLSEPDQIVILRDGAANAARLGDLTKL